MYDVIIIGAGPAGITASIYAARKRMNFMVITRDVGGQTLWTRNIENYTGYLFITGHDLVDKFYGQLEQFGVPIKEQENVLDIKRNNDTFTVMTDKAEYGAKTVIIASGRIPRKLGVPGEDEYRNKGVAYCATCDAPMFAGKDVLVVGGGNAAIDSAIQFLKIANKIYIADIAGEFRADPVLVEKIVRDKKVTVMHATVLKEIYGDKFVSGARLEQSGEEKKVPVHGVFIEIGSIPASHFAKDLEKNENGEIFVDCGNTTSIPGIFAAGDVTSVPAKQIVVACGEGAKALISAFNFINKK